MRNIVARLGDLTNTNAPVVVNAGNTSLWLGSGVAGAIAKQGGPTIQKALDIISTIRSPKRKVTDPDSNTSYVFPCSLGDVEITHAGNMKARLVFHAAVMDCKGLYKGRTTPDIVYECTKNCMLELQKLSITGITFPIFGTGIGGLDIKNSVDVMLQALRNYPMSDCLVRLYAYSDADYAVVATAVERSNEAYHG